MFKQFVGLIVVVFVIGCGDEVTMEELRPDLFGDAELTQDWMDVKEDIEVAPAAPPGLNGRGHKHDNYKRHVHTRAGISRVIRDDFTNAIQSYVFEDRANFDYPHKLDVKGSDWQRIYTQDEWNNKVVNFASAWQHNHAGKIDEGNPHLNDFHGGSQYAGTIHYHAPHGNSKKWYNNRYYKKIHAEEFTRLHENVPTTDYVLFGGNQVHYEDILTMASVDVWKPKLVDHDNNPATPKQLEHALFDHDNDSATPGIKYPDLDRNGTATKTEFNAYMKAINKKRGGQ